jgi:hypothetical protein
MAPSERVPVLHRGGLGRGSMPQREAGQMRMCCGG